MTTAQSPAIHVPSSVGPDALAELDRVPWLDLANAYTPPKGYVGPTGLRVLRRPKDVGALLARLGDRRGFRETADEIFACICHQGGTIYEVTAYAVPYLAAFAAGADLDRTQRSFLVALFAGIGLASTVECDGRRLGWYGPNVGPLTTSAIRASSRHLAAAARRNEELAPVVSALAELVQDDVSLAAVAARLERILDDAA